jgi:enamine deaminase RidA (YjgF/YER057c/UK114 family)
MLENIDALLAEVDMQLDEDVAMMTVYLRDIADYNIVKSLFEKRFPTRPKAIVQAPVCRPGWLIEMECICIKEAKNEFRNF